MHRSGGKAFQMERRASAKTLCGSACGQGYSRASQGRGTSSCLQKSGARSYVWGLGVAMCWSQLRWLWSAKCSVTSCWKLEIGHGGRMHTQLASATNQGSPPWKSVKYLPATMACWHAEKVLLIGIKGHWRGFGLGNDWYGFILARLLWRTEPRMLGGKEGYGLGSNCSGQAIGIRGWGPGLERSQGRKLL